MRANRIFGADIRYPVRMTVLGPLAGESPEPTTEAHLQRIEARLRAEWSGVVSPEKRDAEQLIGEIRWLREHLRGVEHVIEPLLDAVAYSQANGGLNT